MEKDYICGCGKSYGSYPAFSTHRKTKHNNVTVPGTVLPSQQKAKRGRPSCDFKRVPQVDQSKKEFYQGINIIQCGLLQLQQKYKGKIISTPYENNENNLDDLDSDDESDKKRIQAISIFVKLMTTHMQNESSNFLFNFFKDLVNFGIQTSQLSCIHVYNTFCLKNYKQLANSPLGISFCIQICLLLSKWLCVMGYSKQILRAKARANCSIQQGSSQ